MAHQRRGPYQEEGRRHVSDGALKSYHVDVTGEGFCVACLTVQLVLLLG